VKKKKPFVYIRAFLPALLLVSLASCDIKILALEDSPVAAYITPVHMRQVYYVNDGFDKNTELSVMVMYPNGGSEIAPIEQVSVSYAGARIDDILFTFSAAGGYTLDAGYEGMSTSYNVTVIELPSSGSSDPSGGDGNGDDGGGDGNGDDGFGILIRGP
jgi:hypothetical protein